MQQTWVFRRERKKEEGRNSKPVDSLKYRILKFTTYYFTKWRGSMYTTDTNTLSKRKEKKAVKTNAQNPLKTNYGKIVTDQQLH